jgi:cyclopropane-fatty-acyl-phospholipid synthase
VAMIPTAGDVLRLDHDRAAGSPARAGNGQAGSARGPTPTSVHAWDRWLAALVWRHLQGAAVRLRLWDGSTLGPDDAVGTIVIADRATLLNLVRDPDIAFGDAFMQGRIDISGDLPALLESTFRAQQQAGPHATRLQKLIARSSTLSLSRARENIHHHYDIGNDFYALWLDRAMVYTCAYFPDDAATLEAAQVAKMDHLCRKLRLRPGESVIEAGCGWGALAMHMAARCGVHVRAFNISAEQIRFARRRARDAGLAARVEFIEDDYRNVRGQCDAFVSVGMLEHVGLAHYPDLGRVMHRVLPGHRGRGLLHFIGRNRALPLHPWISRRIFPGAYPPTLAEVCTDVLGPWDFSVLDVENLRLHYARTLTQWLTRFEASYERVVEMFDEAFARAWRLYLAGSTAAFRAGSLQLFQVMFARGGDNDVPWTRAHLYGAPPSVSTRPAPGTAAS